jgi:hypothetical protein
VKRHIDLQDTTQTGKPAKNLRKSTEERRRRVFVEALELMGSIGVYEHEHRDRQLIVVSLTLDVVDTYDGQSDRLAPPISNCCHPSPPLCCARAGIVGHLLRMP